MARTSLGPWKFIWNMGSSSHWGLIMAQDRKQMAIMRGNLFYLLYNNGTLSADIRTALMTTYRFLIHRGYSNVWSEYDFYFIEWSEKMYISWVPKARMKYTFFHFTRWNKSHIHDKHLNFLFIIYITFDRRDANLAFARESLTRSFVPWRHDVHVLFCLVTLDMTSETRIGV